MGNGSGSLRVLVLTAPVGEGHVAAARNLSEEIRDRNQAADVRVVDVLAVLPAPLRWALNDAYRWQLQAAPWLFAVLFGALRRSRLLRRMTGFGLSIAGSRSLLRLLRQQSADVVVSTWPPATTMLGHLRLRGRLRVPVCATITDFAGLELWTDKGVDLHLVMHQSLVPKVERLAGRGSAQHVSPLVAGEFRAPRARATARRALGVAPEGPLVVVSGGGWGVGDLSGAVEAALHVRNATVLCLAGRDETTRQRLEESFGADPRVTVLGFTDRMGEILAAADVLVHSTGGVTSLEALVLGCPVVAYGAPRGHARLLACEMASLGLVSHARSTSELTAALVAVPTKTQIGLTGGGDAASLVLTMTPRVVAPLRARVARTAMLAASVAAVAVALLASDLMYPVVAEALSLHESTSIATKSSAAALVVQGRPGDLRALAAETRRLHFTASVASAETLSERDVAELRRSGLDPIPELEPQGPTAWLDMSHQIGEQRAAYGLGESFYYLAPSDGFSIVDYLLARRLGGQPIRGRDLLATPPGDLSAIHPGEIVVATLDPGSARSRLALLSAVRRLTQSGHAISSVQRLAAQGAA